MQYSAYIFDAYGTLFDVHSAVRRHAAKLGPDGHLLSEIWRTKQLEYSWVGTLMGEPTDFWKLTVRALDYAFAKVPSADRSQRDNLLETYWHLDCYPEVPSVLSGLKNAGYRIAILSNGRLDMLRSAVENSGIDQFLDDIFSVDQAGQFKPVPAVYRLVTTAWNADPSSISFQSSNRWDVAGARNFGFRTVWINRSGEPDEYQTQSADLILPSLIHLKA